MAEIQPVENVSKDAKRICPTAEELSVITNNIKCAKCGLVFRNEPRFRLHDLKVHQRKNLDKTVKENVRYHCPIQSCVYAENAQRHFSTMKYLKQHYLKVHAEKSYACSQCDKSFSTESAKEGHMRICGTEFLCSCSKSYTTYEALLTHAKRMSHSINDKYKNSSRRSSAKVINVILPTSQWGISEPVSILPTSVKCDKRNNNNQIVTKSTCDIAVQTDECKKQRRISSPSKHASHGQCHGGKRRVSKQTQTNVSKCIKNNVASMETQTSKALCEPKYSLKVRKRRKSCGPLTKSDCMLIKEDISLGNFNSNTLFPSSPLPLRHDSGLTDFWEDKNTSGTQTIPEKDMFEVLNDNVTQTEFDILYDHTTNPLIQCASKSTEPLLTPSFVSDTTTVEGYTFEPSNSISTNDPMLTDKTFDDKFSSIETQTEQVYSQSYFDSDTLSRSFALSSNIETQTTDNIDNIEQLLYSNTCTQTCDEILTPDLGLSNIQTQTAWTKLEDTTVSTETQTKSLICETGCNMSMGACRSWLSTQTNHTETQTDLLSFFEGLQ